MTLLGPDKTDVGDIDPSSVGRQQMAESIEVVDFDYEVVVKASTVWYVFDKSESNIPIIEFSASFIGVVLPHQTEMRLRVATLHEFYESNLGEMLLIPLCHLCS